MATHVFRYSDWPIDPSPAFPEGLLGKRPVVNVSFPGRASFSCLAVIDSGAEFVSFPKRFMAALGIDPENAPLGTMAAVGSKQDVHFYPLRILVERSLELSVLAGFTEGLNDWNAGLLGQNGFFDRGIVNFDFLRNTITFETYEL